MYGWPQQVGQASAAVSRLCEAAVVTNLSTQPHSWEFLEVHLSVVDRAALACWDDVCLWVVCPVRGTFPPPLVDSGASSPVLLSLGTPSFALALCHISLPPHTTSPTPTYIHYHNPPLIHQVRHSFLLHYFVSPKETFNIRFLSSQISLG
ncbi:uncharacterized protein LAJ45_09829 [Morchella importuna]|uniref:uncharacterized protein n=1 Tax=Morchella importuna TaxID=1174673 RepID=UPI001E8CB30A|nr:uncharacterized protein LAJ45_09829 [Morchella importuna]KAH8146139.1 hypothetical protein LAJ45_09829 [Morchella importuna]